ncbi:Hypothetical predicted protein [Xyrichtys novacula]|uniref:Uncharacterized protein n=1 Tax=Xyrichtys novacula TaxID=13765 RepID=A0AAV1ETC1_XYRNO|nr:Hypothetical predicted protein [Xyrichtys novacula]
MELTVSFYCLHHLSSPFMEEKKMSMCSFTALCVSQFKRCNVWSFTGAQTRFATGFFKMIGHMLFGFLYDFSYLASSCFYHVYQSSSSKSRFDTQNNSFCKVHTQQKMA